MNISSGHSTELFLKDESQLSEFLCPICTEICRNPVITFNPSNTNNNEACGHSFCSECIQRALEMKRECASCRSSLQSNQLIPDMRLRRAIGSLRVKCSNSNCDWTGEFGREGENLSKHVNSSACGLVQCPNSNCTVKLSRDSIPRHQSQCEYRQYPCQYCSFTIVYRQKSDHALTCEKFSLSCINGCGVVIERGKMSDHIRHQCRNTIVSCDYSEFGCEWRGSKHSLPDHEEKSTREHLNLQSKLILTQRAEMKEQREKIADLSQQVQNLSETVSQLSLNTEKSSIRESSDFQPKLIIQLQTELKQQHEQNTTLSKQMQDLTTLVTKFSTNNNNSPSVSNSTGSMNQSETIKPNAANSTQNQSQNRVVYPSQQQYQQHVFLSPVKNCSHNSLTPIKRLSPSHKWHIDEPNISCEHRNR